MWVHRADLAESAINERHSIRLWGFPRTNLAVVAWPPHAKEKFFFRWNYWWQAHYLDCLVDAATRRPTKRRKAKMRATINGIWARQLTRLTHNKYYDDRTWLALAMGRSQKILGGYRRKALTKLEQSIIAGIDPTMKVLPWRVGDSFYNVPTNGPAAIMLVRLGRVDQAREIIDWIFDNLIDEKGLIMDGLRTSMNGFEIEKNIYSYCQGVVIGACVEIALALRNEGRTEESIMYLAHARSLIHAVAKEMADSHGVINVEYGDGDGGLFNGILARYLAEAAVRIPTDYEADIAAREIAARLVMASAESLWEHRLEVDGLPVFATKWTEDARLPHNYGLGASAITDIIRIVKIEERDLSVQLSGWMLLEAAARVSLDREHSQQS